MRVCDIGSHDPDLAAVLFTNRVDAALRGIAWLTTTGQHQVPGTVGGKVSRDLQPDRTKPTGHQIRGVVAKLHRRGARVCLSSNQTRHVEGLPAQCDLVFAPPGHHLADEAGPFVG